MSGSAISVAAEPIAEDMLFQPCRLGPYHLPHRIVMAPLTRSRARQPGNVPGPFNACYYAQRSSAALIISEATQVSMQGQGHGSVKRFASAVGEGAMAVTFVQRYLMSG